VLAVGGLKVATVVVAAFFCIVFGRVIGFVRVVLVERRGGGAVNPFNTHADTPSTPNTLKHGSLGVRLAALGLLADALDDLAAGAADAVVLRPRLTVGGVLLFLV
jgi:hypothetical protein